MIELHKDPLATWLLDSVIEYAIDLDVLVSSPEEFEHLTNLPAYSAEIDPSDVRRKIVDLKRLGLIEVTQEGVSVTSIGASLWEDFRRPNWQSFFCFREEEVGDLSNWVVSSLTQYRIREVVGFYLLVDQTVSVLGDCPPVINPIRPFVATYWKCFENGWEISVSFVRKPNWGSCWLPQHVIDWSILDWRPFSAAEHSGKKRSPIRTKPTH
ncbi:hypothetical protein VN12_05625 [Pirellula sp. SH-Sr6A]|uniref:hypothetical protein n=1 Tax=Pirellula sp. SH-Sr6A TaxID=1632865 RepID=UPI00078B3BC5|nr:hypothetical protein [Pirellula sp. SH-Sr6A]AMV31578.1 hypothetical protein VN12_05625 [Pirellula sp. SH-Sr6A]